MYFISFYCQRFPFMYAYTPHVSIACGAQKRTLSPLQVKHCEASCGAWLSSIASSGNGACALTLRETLASFFISEPL